MFNSVCLHTVPSVYIQCSMKASIDFDVRGKKPVPDAKMVSVHMLVLGLDALCYKDVLLLYVVLEFLNSAKNGPA